MRALGIEGEQCRSDRGVQHGRECRTASDRGEVRIAARVSRPDIRSERVPRPSVPGVFVTSVFVTRQPKACQREKCETAGVHPAPFGV
jgi:hypothetical protein